MGDGMADWVMKSAQRAFGRWVNDSDVGPQELFEGHVYVGSLIMEWILFGDGVEYTGRHYETYLRVCLAIANAAMNGEVRVLGTDRKAMHINGIENPNVELDYTDRAFYEVAVTRWEHEGRGILSDETVHNHFHAPPFEEHPGFVPTGWHEPDTPAE